ncbi:MAG TPA: superoxide dismutase [Candidatus Acidoferrales bacterium]|nr:superoxide dismutase [Candidatus Acidoferrales bacterium]
MKFELPPLPYDYSALEPHISARTLHFHYDKHHRGYLEKLRKEIGETPTSERSLVEIIRSSSGSVFNNAAQVWNHSFYWDSMTPHGPSEPNGALLAAIKRDFGSVAELRAKLKDAAVREFGSGWAWLVATPAKRLQVVSSDDADNPLRSQNVPLLNIDVWEHAYYLDYQNERANYVQSFLDHLVNWKFATQNFER